MVVALVLLGPAVVRACLRKMPTSWEMESQEGRFELLLETMQVGASSRPSLTLRDRRAGKVVWQRGLEHGVERQSVLLSPDGRYLALVDALSSEVSILGPNGAESGRWSLDAHLTEGERRKLHSTLCGSWWIGSPRFEGNVLTLVVPMELPPSHPEAPYPGPVPGIRFRIDPTSGHVSREEPFPEMNIEALLQEYGKTIWDDKRREIVRGLAAFSQRTRRGSNPELRRFWLELVRDSRTNVDVWRQALEGLSAIGTDEEIRGLFASLLQAGNASADPLSPGALMLLERRFPEEAVRQSVRVLTERPPSIPFDSLRVYAVFTLGQRPGSEIDKALRHALRDPAPLVRASALYQVSQRMTLLQGIELALPFLEDSEEVVQYRAASVLCDLLRRAKGSDRSAALELLRRAEAGGKLARFPEGLILLAAVADRAGDRARALALYGRGLEAMADIPEQRGWKTYSVRLEAKLQLALEAKAQGRKEEVQRLAREVLEDRSRNVEVCAPAPNVYLPFGRPDACAAQKTAAAVAAELLASRKPGGNP
ncbi:HEAT repeat domain-containing protein [Archangium minus]|uniref:HEAT repeat domain-containing protein n=1 Tax=Archangium minus TaxID=83450 RepID=A0ABY9X4I3_9BACT|nr:HEAT repeat domain-containing protein [Archangium minus]